MDLALKEAKNAYKLGEVPIGCVVVLNGEVIATAHNMRESTNRISSHAEINALDLAGVRLKRWHLEDCELYVTVEPCLMCYSAILQSRIKKVYIGSRQMEIKKQSYRMSFNQSTIIDESLLSNECSNLMMSFFELIRKQKRGELC